jgi:S-adenosylmethionine decarboxylase
MLGWQLNCQPNIGASPSAVRFSPKGFRKVARVAAQRLPWGRDLMEVGVEWLIDATGCRSDLLADADVLRNVCEEIIDELGLHVVGEGLWHQFPPPGGITAMYLLKESHLSLHTFPENGIATFNLYCCRPRRRWEWEDRLAVLLGAAKTLVREIARGSAEMGLGEGKEVVSPFREVPTR